MKLFKWLKKEPDQVMSKKSGSNMLYMGSEWNDPIDGGGYFINFGINLIIYYYRTVSPLAAALEKKAKAIAGLPYMLIDKKSGKEISSHPLIDLLNHPNNDDQRTKKSLFHDLSIWRNMAGNSYLYASGDINKQPIELYVLKPQFITVQSGMDGYAESYRYSNIGDYKIFNRDKMTDRFISDTGGELMIYSEFNPTYSAMNMTGASPILPLMLEIEQYFQSSVHNKNLLKNGLRTSGVFTMNSKDGVPVMLTDEQFYRMKNEIMSSYQGSRNSGSPMLLEADMEFQEMGKNNKDMDFLELKKEAEKQIYHNCGVPIELFIEGSSTYNNKQSANLQFYENTVLPEAYDMLDALNNFLLPRYKDGDKITITINENKIGALEPKRMEERKIVENSAFMTTNEKREVYGMEPIKGGDTVYTASGVAIAGDVTQANDISTGQQKKKILTKADGFNIEEDEPADNGDLLALLLLLSSPALSTPVIGKLRKAIGSMVDSFGNSATDKPFKTTPEIEKWVKDRSEFLLESINDTTARELSKVVSEAIAGGATKRDLVDQVETVFDNADIQRAKLAAITESTVANGFASFEAFRLAGISKKIWVSVQDRKVRDTHAAMDGQVRNVNDLFLSPSGDQARYPGGFATAAENINCRCAAVPFFESETIKSSSSKEKYKAMWDEIEKRRLIQEEMMMKVMLDVYSMQREVLTSHLKRNNKRNYNG